MTAEPRDVEEIRTDIALWAVHPFGAYPTHEQHCARERLLADVEPLLDRLAAADRENAELRGEVERLRNSVRLAVQAVNAEINRRRDAEAERDDLRAQLAAAQAQLADAVSKAIRRGDRAGLAEARLEAVQALHRSDGYAWSTCRGCGREWPCPTDEAIQAAALSAAPQPEPDDAIEARFQQARREANERYDAEPDLTPDGSPDDCDHGGGPATRCSNCAPPASDEPAPSWHVAPDTPDLMAALRASVEAAKERRTGSDEPARCEHGRDEPHETACFCPASVACEHDCPGPAASGTPDGEQR